MLVVPYPGQAMGWLNYELAMQHLQLVKRMLGGGFQFQFNIRTHYLKLYPDPIKESITGWVIFGCHTIRPDTQQYGERWVKDYGLALSKITLGRVRKKYQNTQLLGGAVLDTDVLEEGKADRNELFENLRSEEGGVFTFFVGLT